jgi:SAM-dependent methyltransferase
LSSGFSAEWLALREPADTAARDRSPIASCVADWLVSQARSRHGRPLRILDLGSGSGANLRYLAPRLGPVQTWRLVDNDAALLADVPRALRNWAQANRCSVDVCDDHLYIESPAFSTVVDLEHLDLATGLDPLTLGDVDLITASALLDLTSFAWIEHVVQHCRRAGCAVLFALSYDGRTAWGPKLAMDEQARRLLNRHQRSDKGFGPAAGPQAVAHAAECLQGAGFQVQQGRSDWLLSAADGALQAALATGWAQAATAVDPRQRARITEWRRQRLALIQQRDSELKVGHIDLFGVPRAG